VTPEWLKEYRANDSATATCYSLDLWAGIAGGNFAVTLGNSGFSVAYLKRGMG